MAILEILQYPDPRLHLPAARVEKIDATVRKLCRMLGLGLMISTHIVREFGGHLSARNLEPCGAEFLIDLPATFHAAGA